MREILILLNLAYNKKKAYHQDYDHVTTYADKLKAIFTGDAKGLLKKFDLRESEDEFKNRVKLTSFICPAIARKCTSPLYKVLQIDGVKDVVEPEKEAEEILKNFDGQLSVDDFIKQKVSVLKDCDPNSWVVVDFKDFNYRTEKAKPFPIIYSSHAALDYELDMGDLHYLITSEKGGYNMWLKGYGYKLRSESDQRNTQALLTYDKVVEMESLEIPEEGLLIKIGSVNYRLTRFDQLIDKVPAFRVGHKLDVITEFRTYESTIHNAIPRIDKIIKSDSELDMAMAMHTFPQKIVSMKDCTGTADSKCYGGYDGTGDDRNVCSACNGDALVPVHKSTQDIVYVKNSLESREEQLDLDNIVKYIKTDVESVKFMYEYTEKQGDKCFVDCYNSNINSESGTEKTATESGIDYEFMHYVLHGHTGKISEIRTFLVDVIAQFKDIELESNQYAYPTDLNIQTFKELLNEYKSSEDAPEWVRKDLIMKMSRKINSQSPTDQMKFSVRLSHDPWGAKTNEDKKYLISQNLCDDRQKVLYSLGERIFTDIENKNENFYQLTYDKRQTILDEELDKWVEKLFTQTVQLNPALEISA